MPKMKSKRSLMKKIRITGKKKVMRRYTKQNHFNSKQTGKFKRKKRLDRQIVGKEAANILKAIN
ncbi:MAG: 50S ribosomal protein L35 [Candidatus Moranbacteria bacterium]|jgi:ribosomal protein L35|nr:50S ribosomal protein L35 [Candidatus Moranbacteria bacterium]MDD5652259.1 50S ribosomal protein L35 [Candidatus Moranbacteria bacterium]